MSYGGLIARAFQYHYPEKVCGMVMVDALEESFGYRPEFAERVARGRDEILANVRKARFGLMRLWLLKHREVALPEPFSDASQRQFRASFARLKFWKAVLDDADSVRRSESVVRKFGSLGDLPLAVLRHGKDDPTLVLPTMTPPQAEEAGASLKTTLPLSRRIPCCWWL
jgi:pimeloyl-ACP methyl ester carboxylesterase